MTKEKILEELRNSLNETEEFKNHCTCEETKYIACYGTLCGKLKFIITKLDTEIEGGRK